MSNVVVIAAPRSLIAVVMGGTCGVTGVVGIPVVKLIRGVDCFRYPSYGGGCGVFNRDGVSRITGRLNIPILTHLPVSPGATSLISGNTIRLYSSGTVTPVVSGLPGWATGCYVLYQGTALYPSVERRLRGRPCSLQIFFRCWMLGCSYVEYCGGAGCGKEWCRCNGE